ncbi:MAG: hypothetical protein ACK5F0_08445 [Flavobacteriales bacterium]|jgi:hypothetical protein
MRKWISYFVLLISPFLLMVAVNESTKKGNYPITVFNSPTFALNPGNRMDSQCTWDCHTNGCSHRAHNTVNIGVIDDLYKQIIDALQLKEGGDVYQVMNIIFLVILWPLLMFVLLVANIELFRNRKKKNG